MCDCIPPPPLFDLPPPPDPSLVWHLIVDSGSETDIKVMGDFFHRTPEATCDYLNGEPLNVINSVLNGNFWHTFFTSGSSANINYFYYFLAFLFFILFISCSVAICILRIRKNRLRLKSSQRSTPSLNSSKLSTETIGTATATMIASVGSVSRNGANNVATLLKNKNCKLPQMYQASTMSRCTYNPSQYYLQQQHQNNSINGSCCNCANENYCYATAVVGSEADVAQKVSSRIFNSKSATNIFGSNGYTPQQRMLYHKHEPFTKNNALQMPQYSQYQLCSNGTLMRLRCATVKYLPQMVHVTHSPAVLNNFNHCQNYDSHPTFKHENQGSYPNQGYCTMPYEYEEIANSKNPSQTSVYCRTEINDKTDATIFEDLSENLRNIDEQQCRLPPPLTKPPPIPTKRSSIVKLQHTPPPHPNLPSYQQVKISSSKSYQIPQVNYEFYDNSRRSSNLSLLDAELQRYTINDLQFRKVNSGNVNSTICDGKRFCDNLLKGKGEHEYVKTCDDAISLTTSPISGDEQTKVDTNNTHLNENIGNSKLEYNLANSCQTGRESGYGTEKSRQLLQASPKFQQPAQQRVTLQNQGTFDTQKCDNYDEGVCNVNLSKNCQEGSTTGNKLLKKNNSINQNQDTMTYV